MPSLFIFPVPFYAVFFLLFFDPVGLMNLPHKQLRAKDTFSASWAWCNASAWTSPESQISRMKRTSTLIQPLENDISFYLKYLKNRLHAPSIAPKRIWRTASERKLWNINHLCNYLQASGGLPPQGECPSRGGQPRHENQDKECARNRNQSLMSTSLEYNQDTSIVIKRPRTKYWFIGNEGIVHVGCFWGK